MDGIGDGIGDGIRGRTPPLASGAEPEIDHLGLRRYRLARVRDQLRALDISACVLFDPLNIRYASGTSNMQVWTQHSPDRYLLIITDGPVLLFDNYVKGRDLGWTGNSSKLFINSLRVVDNFESIRRFVE